MNHGPEAANSVRQQSSILVLGLHDHAVSLKLPEVFGQRKRDSRTTARVGGVGDRILLQFRDISDSGVFDPPDLFGVFARICYQSRLGIDAPTIDAIRGASSA